MVNNMKDNADYFQDIKDKKVEDFIEDDKNLDFGSKNAQT